jgi:hypothetical protein
MFWQDVHHSLLLFKTTQPSWVYWEIGIYRLQVFKFTDQQLASSRRVGLEYLHCTPAQVTEVNKSETQCLWLWLSLGDINTGTRSSKLWDGCKADDLALLKKNIVAKPKEMKTR